MDESKVIVITGMHRSGTSLFTSYLQKCGLELGNSIIPPDIGNPLGYFENKEITDFHSKLLAKFHQSLFQVDITKLRLSESLYQEARVLSETLSNRGLIVGFKDPRTAFFLDLWQSVLGYKFRVLFLFRDPLAVANSLLKRNTDSILRKKKKLGLVAWYTYNTAIVEFMKKNPKSCVCVELEDFLAKPNQLICHVNKKWGTKLSTEINLETVYQKNHLNSHKTSQKIRQRLYVTNPFLIKKCQKLYLELRFLKLKF